MDMPRLVLIVDFANILLRRGMDTSTTASIEIFEEGKIPACRERIIQTLDNEYYNFHENSKRNARQGIENSYQADMLY